MALNRRKSQAVLKAVGRNMATARKGQGLSQQAMAGHVQKTVRTVARWEKGEVECSLLDLVTWADVCFTSVGRLLGEVDPIDGQLDPKAIEALVVQWRRLGNLLTEVRGNGGG